MIQPLGNEKGAKPRVTTIKFHRSLHISTIKKLKITKTIQAECGMGFRVVERPSQVYRLFLIIAKFSKQQSCSKSPGRSGRIILKKRRKGNTQITGCNNLEPGIKHKAPLF